MVSGGALISPAGPKKARVPAVAVVCLGVGAARPPPLFLGLALVLLLSIPWGFAVAHYLANRADSPTE